MHGITEVDTRICRAVGEQMQLALLRQEKPVGVAPR